MLAGQGDHAFDKVRFDNCLANLAFALGVTAHRAIAQDCVFVDGSVQIGSQRVGCGPEFLVQVAEESRIVGHE